MGMLQQHIFRKLRNYNNIKREEMYMIIKGKIPTTIRLSDINKNIGLGQEVSLTEYDVNRSRDLQNAIKREWVEIVFDRSMLKRAVSIQGSQEKVTDPDLVSIAKNMAQTMAEEMVKNSPLIREMAKEIAKEMVLEIKDNFKSALPVEIESRKISIQDQKPDNVFIDFNDDDVKIETNISEIGTVEVKKDDLSGSLEKMKRFKKG